MNLGQLSISLEPIVQPNGSTINVCKYYFEFIKWDKLVSFDSYNGKPVVSHKGEPLFAELKILKLLEEQGYNGVWVDTYRNKFWQGFPMAQPVILDGFLLDVFNNIRAANGGHRKGCWDVLAAKEDKVIFIELKRRGKDAVRQTQLVWLNAAIEAGYSPDDFIIAEWDFLS